MKTFPIALLVFWMVAAGAPAATIVEPEPVVTVSERDGLYSIAAEFSVPQTGAVAMAVLTDYDAIPRFMPDVKSSRVIQRSEGRVLLEQEAVARMMMFSKRIQLLLEVDETPDTMTFRDRSGKSFLRYEGAWRIGQRGGETTIAYEVLARPAFDVPEFILKRLLKRDATRMIQNLRREMQTRGAARPAPPVGYNGDHADAPVSGVAPPRVPSRHAGAAIAVRDRMRDA